MCAPERIKTPESLWLRIDIRPQIVDCWINKVPHMLADSPIKTDRVWESRWAFNRSWKWPEERLCMIVAWYTLKFFCRHNVSHFTELTGIWHCRKHARIRIACYRCCMLSRHPCVFDPSLFGNQGSLGCPLDQSKTSSVLVMQQFITKSTFSARLFSRSSFSFMN